jgi:hypothetical protein
VLIGSESYKNYHGGGESHQLTDVRKGWCGVGESVDPEAGVLDEPDPAGLADYKASLKLPPLMSVEELQRYTVHNIV